MADFGGWEMPIEYPSDIGGGVLNEHQAVRQSVGIFDVSHLGKIEVKGPSALEFLNQVLTNDLLRIKDSQAQYSMICDPGTGGVIDDLIVYRRSHENFLLIPNAANSHEVHRRMNEAAPEGISIENVHEKFGVIAIQGPRAGELIDVLGFKSKLEYMSFAEELVAGISVIICRTGYTGELGFEILPLWDEATQLWEAIEGILPRFGGLIAGLGARDTLRTEMGYPLHGHELSMDITPVQANANWAVGWDKSEFWGKEVLVKERSSGPRRILRGMKMLERGIPRGEMGVYKSEQLIGLITSGTFSPTLKTGIAIGLIEPEIPVGEVVSIDVRGRKIPAQIVKLPFVPSHVR